jgi:hypothetical protein
MAVRLEVELKAIKGKERGKKIKVRALLNSGYESDQPEAVIPAEIARELGFLPNLPPETVIEEYYSVSGKFLARKIPQAIEISLNEKKLAANVVISEFEREVLLSDATISEFGIIIEDAKLGKWRFRE